MKLQFKHQKFQADAAKAVCDVFTGQPYITPTFMIDKGLVKGLEQGVINETDPFVGFRNHPMVPELTDMMILENINKIQRANQIPPSPRLEMALQPDY